MRWLALVLVPAVAMAGELPRLDVELGKSVEQNVQSARGWMCDDPSLITADLVTRDNRNVWIVKGVKLGHTLCRVGAGLVGIDPSGTTHLRPAMTLTAPVVSVRDVAPGTAVGYGHTWTSGRATRLALLPLGYADGLPRAASGRAQVWLHGRRHPVVGLISMDQAVVDVGAAPVGVGEIATVFGSGRQGEPTAAEWAAWSGTIEHEIVTGIGSRVRR